MDYARTIRLDLPYDQAVPKVKEAFKEQGFGTLTEIDVTATLKDKLDLKFPRDHGHIFVMPRGPVLAGSACGFRGV